MYWIAFFKDEGDKPLPDCRHIYDDDRFEANLLCQDDEEARERLEAYPGRRIIMQLLQPGWMEGEELYRGTNYEMARNCL